ncbi:MAG: cytochrome b/b6 domain-containing protein [Candidatus Hydrogenedentes bacterium]|nr:cytochrome b/b6 domain-containing protein [Candidatus Hydrogenedentota bacterium]
MFRLTSIIALAGITVVCVLHYAIFGTKRWRPGKGDTSVYRYSVWERLIHTLSLLAFLTLAGTGFWAVIALRGPLRGWFWMVHAGAGAVFAAAIVLMTLLWAMDCRFAGHDWTWVRHLGGYLGGGKGLPAGRFNAGQKVYFWVTVLLGLVALLSGLGRIVPVSSDIAQETIYQVHRYGALLFVMSVIVHLYLATLANRGTVRSMVLGTVGSEWAKHHHPLWGEEVGGLPDDSSRE